jgi:prolyl oligopeptidase
MRFITALLFMSITASIATADASKQLHDLLRREWDWTMEQNPTWASSLGDRRWNDRWPDVSPAAYERRHLHRQETLKKLRSIDRATLSPADQLSYDLFADQLSRAIEQHDFGWYLIPLNQRAGIQTEYDIIDRLRFDTPKDLADFEARLDAFPRYMDQTIALMRE